MAEPSTPPPAPEAGRRAPRWMQVLLVVSLAVNLAVLGVVGGTMFSHHSRGPDGGREMAHMGGPGDAARGDGGEHRAGRDPARVADVARADRMLNIGPYGTALEVPDRLALAETFRTRAGSSKQGFREMRESFEATLTLLRADPFDPDALRARMQEQNDFIARRQTLSRDLLVTRLSEMTPAERSAFADRLETTLRRGPANGAVNGARNDARP
ncbi:hypothetical protein ATO2_03445 [Roseovarius sp. 22II1-1F6A]|nr:hypothetical protein ATO2_03445 [Roseovarius sp. 22II1-1F6A]